MKMLVSNRKFLSYFLDYLVVVLCIAGFSILNVAEPHHQQFSLSDIYIQQPYTAHERVSAIDAAIIAVLVPVVMMCFWCFTFEGRIITKRRLNLQGRLWESNASVLGLILSVGLALVVTNLFKTTVGRPRPDFIDRCQPVSNATALVAAYGLSNATICQQTDHAILKDGFRSFPSGHSSTSFSGLGYLAIWLSSKLRVLDGSGQIWKIVLVTAPILAASLIAISRIMDERHHPFDILFGSALGLACAWLSYRQYFPSVASGSIAYAARSFGTRGDAIQYQSSEQTRRDTYSAIDTNNGALYDPATLENNHERRNSTSSETRGTSFKQVAPFSQCV